MSFFSYHFLHHGWNYLILSKETSIGGGQQKLVAAYETYG